MIQSVERINATPYISFHKGGTYCKRCGRYIPYDMMICPTCKEDLATKKNIVPFKLDRIK